MAYPCQFLGVLIYRSRVRTPVIKISSDLLTVQRRGFGNGLVQSGAFVALTASVHKDQLATVGSSFYLSANTGTVVGLAATSAVLQGSLRRGLEIRLRNDPNKAAVSYKLPRKLLYPHTLMVS
jgi:hypothetical protein